MISDYGDTKGKGKAQLPGSAGSMTSVRTKLKMCTSSWLLTSANAAKAKDPLAMNPPHPRALRPKMLDIEMQIQIYTLPALRLVPGVGSLFSDKAFCCAEDPPLSPSPSERQPRSPQHSAELMAVANMGRCRTHTPGTSLPRWANSCPPLMSATRVLLCSELEPTAAPPPACMLRPWLLLRAAVSQLQV